MITNEAANSSETITGAIEFRPIDDKARPESARPEWHGELTDNR